MKKNKNIKISKITADEIAKILLDRGYGDYGLYDSAGSDAEDENIFVSDSERTIHIRIVEGYYYADVLGLTNEEFKELKDKLNPKKSEEVEEPEDLESFLKLIL